MTDFVKEKSVMRKPVCNSRYNFIAFLINYDDMSISRVVLAATRETLLARRRLEIVLQRQFWLQTITQLPGDCQCVRSYCRGDSQSSVTWTWFWFSTVTQIWVFELWRDRIICGRNAFNSPWIETELQSCITSSEVETLSQLNKRKQILSKCALLRRFSIVFSQIQQFQ
jgi:hypothetical protein